LQKQLRQLERRLKSLKASEIFASDSYSSTASTRSNNYCSYENNPVKGEDKTGYSKKSDINSKFKKSKYEEIVEDELQKLKNKMQK